MTSIVAVIISGKEIAAALLSERRRTRARPEKSAKAFNDSHRTFLNETGNNSGSLVARVIKLFKSNGFQSEQNSI